MSAMQDAIQKILQAIPADVNYLKEDLSEHTRQVLEDMLRRMDLVSYQEFSAQKQVLAKNPRKTGSAGKASGSFRAGENWIIAPVFCRK